MKMIALVDNVSDASEEDATEVLVLVREDSGELKAYLYFVPLGRESPFGHIAHSKLHKSKGLKNLGEYVTVDEVLNDFQNFDNPVGVHDVFYCALAMKRAYYDEYVGRNVVVVGCVYDLTKEGVHA